jgi:ribonuclease R
VVTIDGEDAKDFDDAVAVERFGDGGTRLYVHIADVSHYVRPGSALDRAALERGTSIYLPDRVIPMLPEALSNNLCSLLSGRDRLTQTAVMDIGPDGEILSHELVDSVIHVAERMTYEKVQAILDGDAAMRARYKRLVPLFLEMETLAKVLRRKREKDGSLDFDLPESKVVLDAQGHTVGVRKVERMFSHRLIEEFMLAANRTVARAMTGLKHPFVYRIHDFPDPDRLQTLIAAARALGVVVPSKASYTPRDLQHILKSVEGKPQAMLIHMLLLRSMKMAFYTTQNAGHFGLGFEDRKSVV